MQARLEALGLAIGEDFYFIKAVNGREMPEEYAGLYDRAKRLRYFGRDLKPGELGCTFSHYKIFQKMVAEHLSHAVVLEDDVIFEEDFPQVLRALLETDTRWDVIRFLGSPKIYKRGCRKIKPLVGEYNLARLPTTPGGAHGYLLTLGAARRMIDYMQSTWMPIDAQQGRMWETELETLVVHPAPLYPDEAAGSTIGDARFDKTPQITGLARMLFPLNRAFFKLSETVGKKYIYWSSYRRDKKAG